MPETHIQKTGRAIGRIFVLGVLAFIVLMGSITLIGLFLQHVKLD